ncbi:hypothetical protein [Vulcanisaeta distributa]|uniref:hypothetical protein n=1 Tax=Vulcanisaeta distributa TaxID=164451 RepID=UPI000A9F6A17|nr:hypothetical protein [Vulcanisaeta distributa]
MSKDIESNVDVYGFLSNVYGMNVYDVDKPLQRILQYFIGKIPSFSELGGAFAGRELLEITDYVDKVSRPRHIMWDVNGNRVDRVWLNLPRDGLSRDWCSILGLISLRTMVVNGMSTMRWAT